MGIPSFFVALRSAAVPAASAGAGGRRRGCGERRGRGEGERRRLKPGAKKAKPACAGWGRAGGVVA